MSAGEDENGRGAREGFLSRWSRVKTDARADLSEPAAGAQAVPAARAQAEADSPAPELPPVDELDLNSDFSGFFHPKVDESVRRSALRKLFSDPHFNVMDGLDTYIDDYSKTEPLPAAMLASLQQARRILDWAAETEEQATARRAALAQAPSEVASEDSAAPAPDGTLEHASAQSDTDNAPDTKP